MEKRISILYPDNVEDCEYSLMSETSWHDLGMDQIVKEISSKGNERQIIQSVMRNISKNPMVSSYRIEVFDDIYRNECLQDDILNILEQVNQLQDFMSLKRNIDKTDGIWTLMRRLKEVKEYVFCVEKLEECLSKVDLRSQGLRNLKDYVHTIQQESAFSALKKDIEDLHVENSKVKSVTLGVNLNEDYEAISMGIVSLNSKQFTQANVLNHFSNYFSKQNQIQDGTNWNNQYVYQTVSEKENVSISPFEKGVRVFTAAMNPLMGVGIGLTKITEQQPETNLLDYLSEVANKMLAHNVKKLKEVLSKYATISIYSISGLIPEFQYYILWAKKVHFLQEQGYWFTKPMLSDSSKSMDCENAYNLKLATIANTPSRQVVGNNLDFSKEHNFYILTGANRGGKTTITQAIGQMFVLAQAGIYVPASFFQFKPIDNVFTHFPADEDKTMDYGRLGEECQRFKKIYEKSTKDSLILLNESFSTTSFEEGYYIARDAIKAILLKESRTVYNTHMHKLSKKVDDFNGMFESKAVSLIVETDQQERSYKVKIAPSTGVSLASDIATKYGVTFEQLTK